MDNDTPQDAIVLVSLTAGAIRQHSRYGGDDLEEIIERASAILCFIFKLAKPPSYVEGMTEVRAQYRGIAEDAALRRDFRGKINEVAREGYLRTLSAAIEAEVWRTLRR